MKDLSDLFLEAENEALEAAKVDAASDTPEKVKARQEARERDRIKIDPIAVVECYSDDEMEDWLEELTK